MKTIQKHSSLRVIAGTWRSRLISFPLIEGLRPTSNRIRETLFNWLQDNIGGEDCLDLFAGSGACGIEALSRGARTVHFVEINKQAAMMIEYNLVKLKASSTQVHFMDAIEWLSSATKDDEQKFGLVFIDPPYGDNIEIECCRLLEHSGRLKPSALIYLESDKKLPLTKLPENWRVEKTRKAGKVNFFLFRRMQTKRKPSSE